jgi:hypothetical protein
MSISRFKACQLFFVFHDLAVELLSQRIDGGVKILGVGVSKDLGAARRD